VAPKTVDEAVAHALRDAAGSARVVRAVRIAVALPPSFREDEAGADARIAVVDGKTLAATLGPLLDGAAADVRVVIVTPLASHGGRGFVSSIRASLRRLTPIARVEACEALRHLGVIRVRVTEVPGSLGLAVLSGRTTLGW
jgi:hypothetical protein